MNPAQKDMIDQCESHVHISDTMNNTWHHDFFVQSLGKVNIKDNNKDMHHSWWRQMETFSALLALCEGNSPVNSPHKSQWRGALMFSKICAWINGWVNNGKTGDLRRHRAHYDVTVMWPFVRGRHQSDSRQGPVVQKPFPCHGVIIFWHYNFPICISNKNVNMLSGWTHREQKCQ